MVKPKRKLDLFNDPKTPKAAVKPSAPSLQPAATSIPAQPTEPVSPPAPAPAVVTSAAARVRAMRQQVRSDHIDVQMGICKPYAQTGYCPYGDTCKFAHVRNTQSSVSAAEQALRSALAAERRGEEKEEVTGCACCGVGETEFVLSCEHPLCAECLASVGGEGKCRYCGGKMTSARRV